MKREKIKIGLIGAGRIGMLHAEHLASRIPGAELSSIADVNPEALKDCADKYSIELVFSDYREMLKSKDIDAVVICTSTDTHAGLIVESAEAGKSVFCEKPVALDLKSIDEALKAVKKNNVKLQIGFNRRFDPNPQKIRKLINSGKMGKLQIIRITSRDPAPPSYDYIKNSGGIFLDMMIHDFDMAMYLVNEKVEKVYAEGSVMVDERIERLGDVDTAVVMLKFKNGTIVTIDNSRHSVYGYDQRLEVFGTGQSAVSCNKTPDQVFISDSDGVHSEKPFYFFIERYKETFVEEMKEFVNSVKKNINPPVTGMDGRIAVMLGLAAKESFNAGKPVTVGY